MKKITFFILSFFVLLYLVPIKIILPEKNITNKINNIENNNEIVLLCKYQAITGPVWKVEKAFGVNDYPSSVDIIGINNPTLKLKTPIYNYNKCMFLFYGYFDSQNKAIFHVNKWDLLGNLFKTGIYQTPPYGFNIFEYNIFVSEKKMIEQEKELRNLHLNYEKDGIIKETKN